MPASWISRSPCRSSVKAGPGTSSGGTRWDCLYEWIYGQSSDNTHAPNHMVYFSFKRTGKHQKRKRMKEVRRRILTSGRAGIPRIEHRMTVPEAVDDRFTGVLAKGPHPVTQCPVDVGEIRIKQEIVRVVNIRGHGPSFSSLSPGTRGCQESTIGQGQRAAFSGGNGEPPTIGAARGRALSRPAADIHHVFAVHTTPTSALGARNRANQRGHGRRTCRSVQPFTLLESVRRATSGVSRSAYFRMLTTNDALSVPRSRLSSAPKV